MEVINYECRESKDFKYAVEENGDGVATLAEVQTGGTKEEAARYAREYAKVEIAGSEYLVFRDIKGLVEKYVAGNKTLDYGCGCGRSSRFLKSLGLSVTGVDISEEMIRQASRRDTDGTYALITSGGIPADDNSYDLLFSSWVLSEVSTKSEMMKIGREINRVLKPDGVFIMVVSNENTYNNDWLTKNTEFDENRDLRSGSIVKTLLKDVNLIIRHYFWTKEDYRAMIENSDMQLLETHDPLGKDSDGYDWGLERIMSPVTVYIAKKKKTSSLTYRQECPSRVEFSKSLPKFN